jgi:lysophospholipase L1-like esterase
MPRLSVEDHKQTITVQNNISGDRVRLMLSNAGNPTSVDFADFTITTMNLGKEFKITVNGDPLIHLEACEEIFSDEISLPAQAGTPFIIKTRVNGLTAVNDTVRHNCPDDCLVQREGNLKYPLIGRKALKQMYGMPDCMWLYGFRAIQVYSEDSPRTVAAFGDSITHMAYWTGELSGRLRMCYPKKASLINVGIGGNRLLRDSSQYSIVKGLFGEAGITRFEKSVFEFGPVDSVIMLEGVNDLCHPVELKRLNELPTHEELIAGLAKLAEIAHKHHTKAFSCTILPFGGHKAWSEKLDSIRMNVNSWICTNDVFDGFFDFAAMVADPNDAARMDKRYDSGDHLHPNAEGGSKMAEGIDIEALM